MFVEYKFGLVLLFSFLQLLYLFKVDTQPFKQGQTSLGRNRIMCDSSDEEYQELDGVGPIDNRHSTD